jgi:hypothetical protein
MIRGWFMIAGGVYGVYLLALGIADAIARSRKGVLHVEQVARASDRDRDQRVDRDGWRTRRRVG